MSLSLPDHSAFVHPASLVGWFTGLSSKFLASRTARLLVLAGTERLDKELMIGQMQGKFQLVVIPGVGHMVHEVRFPTCEIGDEAKDPNVVRMTQHEWPTSLLSSGDGMNVL